MSFRVLSTPPTFTSLNCKQCVLNDHFRQHLFAWTPGEKASISMRFKMHYGVRV